MYVGESRLLFLDELPEPDRFGSIVLLVHDRKLAKVVPGFRNWSQGFPKRLAVTAGEQLKDVSSFAEKAATAVRLVGQASAKDVNVLAVGGGSVGDFAGFLASVLKRGVALSHIPSTWLSALDSSHGGKTALNVSGIKNQVGTFYSAAEVCLVRQLLEAQPPQRVQDAMGEVAKAALLAGGRLWQATEALEAHRDEQWLWQWLPLLIQTKMRIVRKDPFDQTGYRARLNLGHTMGHALEAHYGLPHGVAVGVGLLFSLEASAHLGAMSVDRAARLVEILGRRFGIQRPTCLRRHPLPAAVLANLLRCDKKREGDDAISFVLVRRPGSVLVHKAAMRELLALSRQNGWAR